MNSRLGVVKAGTGAEANGIVADDDINSGIYGEDKVGEEKVTASVVQQKITAAGSLLMTVEREKRVLESRNMEDIL